MARSTTWSDPDRRALAKRYYIDEGLSATQAAKRIGGGVSRSAVIGICHRMGWRRSCDTAAKSQREPRKPPSKPRASPAPTFWTQERLDILKGFVDRGDSASMAAKAMGITRAAALGKAARLGWKFRGYAQKERMARKLVKRNDAPRLKPEPPPPPPPVDVTNARPWETRKPGECAWPLEVDGVTFSCCAPVGHESPNWQYCPGHRRSLSIPTDKAKQRKLHGWILKAVA
jgi:hypothetical protein